MIKKIQFITIALFLFSNALAEGKGNGVGFTFKDFNMYTNSISPPSIYYVINTASGKIEPSLGFYQLSDEYNESTVMNFGIGYLKDKTQSDNYSTYWGGRISMTSNSDSETNIITISPICGAEFSFSDHVSIGGETRFNILSTDETTQMIITPHLFFRFYK